MAVGVGMLVDVNVGKAIVVEAGSNADALVTLGVAVEAEVTLGDGGLVAGHSMEGVDLSPGERMRVTLGVFAVMTVGSNVALNDDAGELVGVGLSCWVSNASPSHTDAVIVSNTAAMSNATAMSNAAAMSNTAKTCTIHGDRVARTLSELVATPLVNLISR